MHTHRGAARWATVTMTAAAVLAGLAGPAQAERPGTVTAAGQGKSARPTAKDRAVLQRDVAAVRKAGGGKVKVLAQARDGHRSVRARSGAAVPWDARFRAASTTKTFTAVVVLQLAEEGKLSLDDTVDTWLPGVVEGNGNDGSRITVRDLLQQTSGLFDYVDDPELASALTEFDKHRYDTTPAREWVAVAMRHKPVFTPGRATDPPTAKDPTTAAGPGPGPGPGSTKRREEPSHDGTPQGGTSHGEGKRWAYSNTNYLLAGMIAEKAGGLPWREQVEHRVIAPLRLRATSVTGANPFMPGPHLRIVLPLPGPDGKPEPVDVTEHSLQHTADSAIVSTTDDLNTFYRALMTGKLLREKQLSEMRRTVERTDDPDDVAAWPEGGYGLGLRETPLSCGGSYWHHEGDGFGSYTRTGVTADGRRSVVISVTSDGGAPDQIRLNTATRRLVDHALCGTRR